MSSTELIGAGIASPACAVVLTSAPASAQPVTATTEFASTDVAPVPTSTGSAVTDLLKAPQCGCSYSCCEPTT